VTPGNSTTTTLTLTPAGGFNQATALTCSGAPAGVSCTISPSSVTPNGTTPVTATVTFQAPAQTASLADAHRNLTLAATLPLGFAGMTALFGLGLGRRRRWPLLLTAFAAFSAVVAVAGCSGGNSSTTTAPVTYPISVTGTAGAITHSATWTVTIQ
jgi:hypothetical protein